MYMAAVANHRLYGENEAKALFLQKPLMVDHHENFDSYLVLATDQSAKKTQSRKNVTRMKGHVFEETVMPRPKEHP